MKYRKKPVVIEAMQANIDNISNGDLIEWLVSNQAVYSIIATSQNLILSEDNWYINILTLEGTMQCKPNDWIIKGIKEEFYPCKPDIFEETYEEVE